jgi:antitoxin component of MazEF toxin-antitoxin module
MNTIQFKRNIRKTGNSLGVVIPPELVELMGIKTGEIVAIKGTVNKITIERIL